MPEFEKRKLKPPPLEQVSDRIDEVLLQQHVNVLLGDYLRSLKDAGSVQILDPQYNSSGQLACNQHKQQRWRCTRRRASWRGAVSNAGQSATAFRAAAAIGWRRFGRVVLYCFLGAGGAAGRLRSGM